MLFVYVILFGKKVFVGVIRLGWNDIRGDRVLEAGWVRFRDIRKDCYEDGGRV